jgi:hypothetical protein
MVIPFGKSINSAPQLIDDPLPEKFMKPHSTANWNQQHFAEAHFVALSRIALQ